MKTCLLCGGTGTWRTRSSPFELSGKCPDCDATGKVTAEKHEDQVLRNKRAQAVIDKLTRSRN